MSNHPTPVHRALLLAFILALTGVAAPSALARPCPPSPPPSTERPARDLQRLARHALCHHRAHVERTVLITLLDQLETERAIHDHALRALRDAEHALARNLDVPRTLSERGFQRYLYGEGGLAYHDPSLATPGEYLLPHDPAEDHAVLQRAADLLGLSNLPPGARHRARPTPHARPLPPSSSTHLASAIDRERASLARVTPPTSLEGTRALYALSHAAALSRPPDLPDHRLIPEVSAALAVEQARRHVLAHRTTYLATPILPPPAACALRGTRYDPATSTCQSIDTHHPGTPQYWLARFKEERELACLREPTTTAPTQASWLQPRCTGPERALRERAASGQSQAWQHRSDGLDARVATLHSALRATSTAPMAHEARTALLRAASRAAPGPARDKALCLAAVLSACAEGPELSLPSRTPWRGRSRAESPCTTHALSNARACRALQ